MSNDLDRFVRVGLLNGRMRSDHGVKNDETMPKQFFAALWFKPMSVELAAMEQIVSHSANKT